MKAVSCSELFPVEELLVKSEGMIGAHCAGMDFDIDKVLRDGICF